MNDTPVATAALLVRKLSADQLRDLAADPLTALRDMGLHVVAVNPTTFTSDTCSCDGAYFPEPYAPRPTLVYVRTPQSRRENFTLLHELGHHLVRGDAGLLTELADVDGDRDLLEERICDAFAGRVLIPAEIVSSVLGGARPRASHLPLLFRSCNGSREACAVRLGEEMGCDGYVALLDRSTLTLRFASMSPEATYAWGRGTTIPIDHPAWRAGESGAFNGEGEIVWATGRRRNMWLDAVGDGAVVDAVFALDRYWGGTGLSILSDASTTRSTPMLLSGKCSWCGAGVYGIRACDKCGDARCRVCGKCGCGAPTALVKTCAKCYMRKGKSQFRAGSSTCRDCDAA